MELEHAEPMEQPVPHKTTEAGRQARNWHGNPQFGTCRRRELASSKKAASLFLVKHE